MSKERKRRSASLVYHSNALAAYSTFTIVAWRQLAVICERYVHKGSKVYIEGRLTQRKYTDKTGVERTAVEVIANDMHMLSPKQTGAAALTEGSDPFLPDDL